MSSTENKPEFTSEMKKYIDPDTGNFYPLVRVAMRLEDHNFPAIDRKDLALWIDKQMQDVIHAVGPTKKMGFKKNKARLEAMQTLLEVLAKEFLSERP